MLSILKAEVSEKQGGILGSEVRGSLEGASFLAAGLPSQKKGDIKRGAVQIDKLEEEHLQREAVLPLRLRPWVL